MKQICEIEPHAGKISSFAMLCKDNSEQHCITAGTDGKTKIWSIMNLTNPDFEKKVPIATYSSTGNERVTSLVKLGTFMSMQMFGMGTNHGVAKLAAITPSTKHRENIIGEWQADISKYPISQMKQLADQHLLAVVSNDKAKLWSYSLGDEGLKSELAISFDSDQSPKSLTQSSINYVDWMFPSGNLLMSLKSQRAIVSIDIQTVSKI